MFKVVYQTPLSIVVQAGRTCWQSQDKGGCYPTPTNDIAEVDKEFLYRILRKNKHGSIAEHCRILICIEKDKKLVDFFIKNNFSLVISKGYDKYYISTNLRVIMEYLQDFNANNTIKTCFKSYFLRNVSYNMKFLFED